MIPPTNRTNVIVIVSDTLRTASLGCYGNDRIHTPNIDRFAAESTLFTEVYPESLPTIPVRRALHTGRRAFPFRDYRPLPWDIVYLPGWQPMLDGESTLAEDIAAAGYHTGFVTDTLPYFAPGLNFTRGFRQWEFTRGKQQDRWASVHAADPERIARTVGADGSDPYNMPRYHIANTDGRMSKDECCTGRSFRWAMRFLEDNAAAPFYLLVDVFDPHEPWEAPEEFYRLYADDRYDGPTIIHTRYDRDLAGLTATQLADVRAHYSGLVSLVDYWFGRLLDKLDALCLADDTLVIFTSDHGTNHGDNLWRVVGKPSWAMLPGTLHLPLIVRHPGAAAGGRVAGLRYNLDVPATVYDATDVSPSQAIEGTSLLDAVGGQHLAGARDYVTSLYNSTAWYRDRRWWVFCEIDGSDPHAFDLESDPTMQHDLGLSAREAIETAFGRIRQDAGGDLPDYRGAKHTDAIGQTPVR